MKRIIAVLCIMAGFIIIGQVNAQNNASAGPVAYTTAILPFNESGEGVKNQGEQIAVMLFAKLMENPELFIVDRADIDKTLKEANLNLSGLVSQDKAIELGKWIGAKIIITGTVFKVKDKTFIIGKVIGTETTAVLGKSVDGVEGIDLLTKKLADGISDAIKKDAKKLMPAVRTQKDIVAEIKKKLGNAKRPKLYVKITERHIGNQTYDPAAETEFQKIAQETGFEVTNNESDADVIVQGEGFSEFAGRHGSIISVKARLEIKALDKKGVIIAVDRKTVANVDLSEQIAGKKALQDASAALAEIILPKLTAKK
ncbi:MAG: hypothetical protein A2017_10825 [Lentisphaerae bacterium GWF2_44_16]|nr:MAG: hypothetical protein A2017_10825 [Lentisphaerae bacterium GWF2_44_16]